MKQPVFTIVLLLLAIHAVAQPFTPDAFGHVSDPQFAQLIRTRAYRLVGSFDESGKNEQNKPVFLAEVLKNDTWIFIDINGKEFATRDEAGKELHIRHPESNIMVSLDYESDFSTRPRMTDDEEKAYWKDRERYRNFKVRSKVGFTVDKDTVLRAEFDEILFEDGFDKVLIVEKNGKYGVYTCKGKLIVPIEYETISMVDDGSPTLAFYARKNGKMGILSREGKVSVPMKYYTLAYRADRRYIRYNEFRIDENYVGAMDTNGRILTPMIYQDIVRMKDANCFIVTIKSGDDYLHGAVDLNGRLVLDTIYSEMIPFGEDIYKITLKGENRWAGGKTGLFHLKKLQIVLPCSYTIDDWVDDPYVRIGKKENGVELYGLIDRTGKVIAEPVYTHLECLAEENLVILQKDRSYGVADLEMNVLLPFRYRELKPLRALNDWGRVQPAGHFIVLQNGKYGVIDLQGKTVIPAVYEKLDPTYSGLIYENNGKGGVINLAQQPLIPEQAYTLMESREGIFLLDDHHSDWVAMDLYGNTVTNTPH